MATAQTAVRDLLDRQFGRSEVVSKQELLTAAREADVGEDALEVMSELPDGEYTHQILEARLLDPIEQRQQAREAGLSGHSEPGFVPPNVRRHPSH
jgi:hypothetical protein